MSFDKMCSEPNCPSRLCQNFKVFVYLLVSLLCYGMIGAFAFMKIEHKPAKTQNEENPRKINTLKKDFTAKHNMTEEQFFALVDAVRVLSCSNVPEWSYDQATSFIMQLLTTIGKCLVLGPFV